VRSFVTDIKSTLLRVLNRHEDPTQGRVLLDGTAQQ
jgi:ABC-type methionine transport system ATPase subunit